MSITEIPSVEAADLLFFSGVQVYYRGKHPAWSPSDWFPLTIWNGRCSKPSEFRTFVFGVETE